MAQAGTIQEISGSVTAETSLGQVRQLKAGDLVYENELIQTSENASVTVALDNGRIITLSENARILIDESVTDVIDAQDATARQAVVQEVEEMQQALESGEDITDAEEETAAGEEDAMHNFVIDYHPGDQSSGAVGSYLLDAEGPAATVTTEEPTPNEELLLTEEAAVPVTDTTVSLTADATVTEAEGSVITYTAQVDNAPQGDMTVTLADGSVITIPDGQLSGSTTVSAADEDVYLDEGTVSNYIVSTSGGNFENVVNANDADNPVSTTITDTIDDTTVSLTADATVTEAEGSVITYTAQVDNAPQGDMTVTLADGSVITIPGGQLSGSTTVSAADEDVYLDEGTVSNYIVSTSGGNFENVVNANDAENPVSTTITDTIDTTTVNLTVSPETVMEGGTITYTAEVDNPPQGDLIITLDDTAGTTITIKDGETSGSTEVTAPDAPDDGTTATVGIASSSGGNYENLDITDTAVVTIGDSTPEGGKASAFVDDEGLTGGIPGGTGDYTDLNTDEDDNEATFSGTLEFNFGADGAGSVDFASMNETSGTLGTENVNYSWDGDSNTLTATVADGEDRAGTQLFTVVVNPTTGEYTVTQLNNIFHEQGSDENDAGADLTYTITDADGSEAEGTLTVTFDDDMPVVTQGPAPVALDEDALDDANADDPGVLTDSGNLVTDGVISWGADSGSITGFTYGEIQDPIALVDGEATIYFGQDGQVTQTVEDAAATLVVTADGGYTFTLTDNMLISGDGEQVGNLQSITLVGADGDGDPVSVPLNATVQDDVPVVTQGPAPVALDEDALDDANVDDPGVLTDSGNLVTDGVISWGADSGSITGFTYGEIQDPIALVDGEATIYFGQDGQVTQTVEDAAATLVVTADGGYTFTLTDNMLISGDGEQVDNLQSITLVGADGDGDPVSVPLNATVQDDVPTVSGTQNSYLGNEDGNSLTASLGVAYGADQPLTSSGGIVLTSTFDGNTYVDLADGLRVTDKTGSQLTADGINLVYAQEDNGDWIAVMEQSDDPNYDGDYVAFRVSVDDTAGTYTVTIEDGVDGAAVVTPIGLTATGIQGGNQEEVPIDVDTDNDGVTDIRITATAFDIDENDIRTQTTVNWFNGGMAVDEGAKINGSGDSDYTTPPIGEILHLEFTDPADTPIFMTTANVTLGGFSGEIGYWEAFKDGVYVDSGYFGTADNPVTVNGNTVTTLIEASSEFDTLEFRSDDADGNGYYISQVEIVNVTESYNSSLTYRFEATDADGDTASGTFDVTFDGDGNITGTSDGEVIKGTSDRNTIDGGDGADIIDGGSGDDTIIFDQADSSVDGGDSYDTLQVADSGILDFSNVHNVEKIDLNDDDTPQTATLSLDHALDMTDADNVLHITGEADDSVTLTGVDSGGWTNEGGGLFANNTGAQVKIESSDDGVDITVDVDDGSSFDV